MSAELRQPGRRVWLCPLGMGKHPVFHLWAGLLVSPAKALGRRNEGMHTEHLASFVWDKFKYNSKPSLVICVEFFWSVIRAPPDETVGCPRLSQSKFICHTKQCLKHPSHFCLENFLESCFGVGLLVAAFWFLLSLAFRLFRFPFYLWRACYLCVCICVYVYSMFRVYVGVCMCECRFICICVYMEARGWYWVPSSIAWHPNVWDLGSYWTWSSQNN